MTTRLDEVATEPLRRHQLLVPRYGAAHPTRRRKWCADQGRSGPTRLSRAFAPATKAPGCVSVRSSPTPGRTTRSQMNTVTIQTAPLGPRGDWPAFSNMVAGNRATFSQPAMGPGAAAHEMGHLMGLRDQYSTTYPGDVMVTTPNPGYAGNIMAENSGRPFESDMTAIINRFGTPSPSQGNVAPAPSSYPAPSSSGWGTGK
jgi:hypothetical protein